MAKFEKNIEKNYVKVLLRGDKFVKRREFEKAIKSYLQVYNFYKERNNEKIFLEVLKKISDSYLELEKYEEALKYLERILELSKKLKNNLLEACTLSDIGLVYKEFYDINKAEPYFIQASKIFDELGSIINVVVSLIHIATVDSIKGNLEESIKKLNKAKDLAIKNGINNQLSIIYGKLAELSLKLGNIDEFKENFSSILDYQKYNDNPQHLSAFLNNAMTWFAQLNLIDDELELLKMNLEVCDSYQLIGSKITCLTNLGHYYSRNRKFSEAEECLNQALNLAETNNLTNEKIGILKGFGLFYREKGDLDIAIKFYLQSLKLSKRFNDIFKVIENYRILARIYENQEKYSEAYRNYSEALKCYLEISLSIKNLKMREKFKENYKFIPELIERINDILENNKTYVKISEQHIIQGISNELCQEISNDKDYLVKSACVENITKMKQIIDRNKGYILETDVRELCRRVYKCDIATTGKEWRLDSSQIDDLIKRGCIKDVQTRTIEIDIYGESNT
ncbi:MAG: tetratricopeptide repeat protein [Promethearchaeota archaeon]|nr:MAG: tetratricopeptide repeat protein [Candidatus Lokiarchaeota archaeon]